MEELRNWWYGIDLRSPANQEPGMVKFCVSLNGQIYGSVKYPDGAFIVRHRVSKIKKLDDGTVIAESPSGREIKLGAMNPLYRQMLDRTGAVAIQHNQDMGFLGEKVNNWSRINPNFDSGT